MAAPSRARRGRALLDAIAASSVLVVLLSLVAPAMNVSRGENRTAGCAENLRLIGRATQAYEDAYAGLPPRRLRSPTHHGVAAVLLPYLGDEGIARDYRLDVDFYSPENAATIARPLRVFQSPTAPRERRPVDVADAGMIPLGRPGAPSDYFTIHSVYDSSLPERLQGNQAAALADDVRTPLAAIADGAAHTLLIAEQAGRPDHWVLGKKRPGDNPTLAGWWGAWPAYNSFNLRTYSADGLQEVQTGGDCTLNCSNTLGIYSFCSGGAHLAMVDGSVRLASPGINRYLLFAFVSRDGGEVISPADSE